MAILSRVLNLARLSERRPVAKSSLLLALLALLFNGQVNAARFVPLGNLGEYGSMAQAISADGKVVVGTLSGSLKAIRWTEAEGIAYLGDGPGGVETIYANAISGDGQTIVGITGLDSVGNRAPYKWTQAEGVIPIAPRLVSPGAISYDGSMIFGNTASDASWDGSVVVGSEFFEAYLDKNGIRTWLGDLPGSTFYSEALAVSPDGSVIVGVSSTLVTQNGQQVAAQVPMMWTEAGGMTAFGDWNYGFPQDISAAKIVIVGDGSVLTGVGYDHKAFRWTPAKGMESIEQLLLDEGIDVAALGWKLTEAVGSSADGRIIAGRGQHRDINGSWNNESWVVELPIPGDFDADGDSDGNDFLEWQRGLGTSRDAGDLVDWRANIAFVLGLGAPTILAVPEPSPVVIIVAVGLLAFRGRHELGAV